MAGTPKVSAKTGNPFAGTHSPCPKIAIDWPRKGIRATKLKPMSKSTREDRSVSNEQSHEGSAFRNIMCLLRFFAASFSAGSELTELTQIKRPGNVSQRRVRGELT
jgi:hypothetical protein